MRRTRPRTRLGKLRRHLLPERYERAGDADADGADARRPAKAEELSPDDRLLLEHPAAREVWRWLTARYRDRRVTPDSSPHLDLGVDSLEWLDLTLEIRERVGVELSEDRIASIETVRDLLQAAVEAADAGGPAPAARPLERPEEFLALEQRRWLQPPGRLVRALGVGVHALNRALLRRLLRVRAEGIEHLPAHANVVLAPNHRSYLDPLALAAVLPRARLEATFWGGWTPLLFANPLARLFSRVTHVVPVDPERAAISSLAFGAAVLRRDLNLVWFPEGGRSPTGELQPFLPGIGALLERFGVPVVPVFIHGTERALPPGRALPRPARVTVVFGPPLDPADLATRGRGQDPADRSPPSLADGTALACLGKPWEPRHPASVACSRARGRRPLLGTVSIPSRGPARSRARSAGRARTAGHPAPPGACRRAPPGPHVRARRGRPESRAWRLSSSDVSSGGCLRAGSARAAEATGPVRAATQRTPTRHLTGTRFTNYLFI